METLACLNKGQKAVVTEIKAEGELRRRLFSFGLRKNAKVRIRTVSLAKSTMEVEVSGGMIALRFDEAKSIGVNI